MPLDSATINELRAVRSSQVLPGGFFEAKLRKSLELTFEKNLSEKLQDPCFLEDIGPLLLKNSGWNFQKAADFVMNKLVVLLPGEAYPASPISFLNRKIANSVILDPYAGVINKINMSLSVRG